MILVFAGAGASKAVNPDNYPTTIEFFERLPDEIKSNPVFKIASEFLSSSKAEEPTTIDIEQIVGVLSELDEVLNATSGEDTFPGFALLHNRLARALSLKVDTNVFASTFARQSRRQIAELIDAVNERVYDFYCTPPKREELDKCWLPFLVNLPTGPFELFTTNYDLVLEQVARDSRTKRRANPIETGRRMNEVTPTLDLGWWNTSREDRPPGGLLTKLHGSVDWSWGPDREQIHVGDPHYHGSHAKHVIGYFGTKSSEEEPFRLFHRYFERCVENASAMLFIGFAFRDDAINEILTRYSRPGPKIVLDPSEIGENIPWDAAQYRHIRAGFDRGSAVKCLEALTSQLVRPSDQARLRVRDR